LKWTTTHFRQEEEVLLPVLARYGEDLLGQEPVVERLLRHARIRGLVMGLSDEGRKGAVRPETLGRISELLETHIRLEEREVFPMIEKVLPEEGLKEVASRLKVKEAGPRTEPWVPKEGLSYEPWPGPGDSEGGGYDWPPTSR
jgi:hemerythrin-like domain-containing protein